MENLQSCTSCIKAKVVAPVSMCPMPQGNTSLILSKTFWDIKVGDSLFCNAITTILLCGSMSRFFVKGLSVFKAQNNLKSNYVSWQNLYSFTVVCLIQLESCQGSVFKFWNWSINLCFKTDCVFFCVCVVLFVHCVFVYLCWAEVPGVPQSNSTCSTHLPPCISFSHFGSHTYRFIHFSSCKTDISSSYITHIKWGMWHGQMRRRRKMRALFTTYLFYLNEL